MKLISPKSNDLFDFSSLSNKIGEKIVLKGTIHRLRILANVTFLILRTDRYLLQTVLEPETMKKVGIENFSEGDFIELEGKIKRSNIKDKAIFPRDIEIEVVNLKLIYHPDEQPPFEINKKILNVRPDLEFDMRPISLRHPKKRSIFKISESVANAFETFLTKKGFTRIFTPKIVFSGAEGGANIFKVKYFDRELYLTQSPQFYKQYGVGIFGKVYEIAPVFRAEKHNTSRHLNEYISMDLEMGFIKDFYEIMELETDFMKFLFNEYLPEHNKFEIELLDIKLPEINTIPSIKLSEAHELYLKYRKKDLRSEPDLAPEEEKFLTQWSLKEYNSEFLFITHFPTKKRPFYTMDDPENPEETLSFDLLFRGIEITTGGQRIHNYKMQVEKLKKFGLEPEKFEVFLQLHKYGIPPHGGLAIGLERVVEKICGLSSVKEASMYPRDINRVIP